MSGEKYEGAMQSTMGLNSVGSVGYATKQVDRDPLENRFGWHEATPEAKWRHLAISQECLALARKLREFTPRCDQQQIALDKLEEVRMWANAAVACNHDRL
jgi:hypothetical protein